MRGLRDTPHNAGATAAELWTPSPYANTTTRDRQMTTHCNDRWMGDIVLRRPHEDD
jgi:hypothetical protein